MSFAWFRKPALAGATFVCLMATPGLVMAEKESSPPKEQEQGATEEVTDDSKVICKKLDDMTGSRLAKTKVCKTRAQWNKEREEAKRHRNRD